MELSASGMTQGIKETPRQMRCPPIGKLLRIRARISPRVALKKTALRVKRKEFPVTSQKVS
jgi:hypothetical protein